MKYAIQLLFILAALFVLKDCGPNAQVRESNSLPDHPRIIFHEADEAGLAENLTEENHLTALHRWIIEKSEEMLDLEPVTYEKTGRRLLDVSRTCLKRVLYLSYSYRLTQDEKFLRRAETEMVAVAGFGDWNPDHFLDVAEMTAALALGYDWLFHGLSEQTRSVIREAIIRKGLVPSKDSAYNSWLDRTNNWNQVCNAGLSLGAMAIYESEPDLAREILDRAKKSLELPLGEYEPDGAYPEGSMYWAYGTTYHVLFIDAYRKAFPREKTAASGNGFMKSAYYFLNVFGPAGSFNYSDGRTDIEYTPAIFWYANELKDNTVLHHQKKILDSLMISGVFKGGETSRDRFLPMIPVWAARSGDLSFGEPAMTSWTGRGHNPVAFHRSSWEESGIFVGIKGGSPSLNHAHMDAGSFVMDAGGVRWAMDLGKHDYHALESTGMDIWDRGQDSERWKVFRYSSLSHNTLTVNGELQRVEGHCAILKNSFGEEFRSTVVDLSPVYGGQLQSATRGIAIAENRYVVVRDEIVNMDQPGRVRWAMLTHDHIEMVDDRTAIIREDQKELTFHIAAPQSAKISLYSTDPPNGFEDRNPGTRMIGFEVEMKAGEQMDLTVLLVPGRNAVPDRDGFGKLSDWQ